MPSFAAYLFLVLSVFVAFGQALPTPTPQTVPTRNVTIKFNSSDVQFSANQWEVISSLSSPSSPPFTSSSDIGATFGVQLPNGTVAVEYIGLPRTGGAAYAVCLDCDLVDDTKGSWSLVDGNDPTLASDDQANATVLFTVADLDPSVIHTMTVTNILDTRFGNSQLTFESLNITVVDNTNGNTEPIEPSTGATSDTSGTSVTSEPTSTSDTVTSSPDSVPTASATDSASSSEPTSPSASSPPTESATDSESPSESTSVPTASPTASGALLQVSPSSASANVNNGSAESTAATKMQSVSQPVVALVVVICILGLFCLAAALILVYLIRRKRAVAKMRDAESQAYGNSQWLTPNHIVPLTGMQDVPLSGAPVRPRNPFEDQFPSDVPLELETPGDSTLMNKRGDRGAQRPRSSFGNGLYVHYESRPTRR